MTHTIKTLTGKELIEPLLLFEMGMDKGVLRVACRNDGWVRWGDAQFIKPCVFEFHIVVVVDIIKPHHFIAPFKQCFGQMKTNKPSTSCY